MLISFSGLDGAGKSTQIEKLHGWLSGHGYCPIIIWARGGYTPGFEFLKRCLRTISGHHLPGAGHTKARNDLFTKSYISRAWIVIAILDLMVLWGVYIRYQRLVGRIVICDRYIDDTLLDFRHNFPHVEFEKSVFWRFLTHITPKPDISFLLWVPVAVSLERSALKREPFPDNEETLEWRLSEYRRKQNFSEQKPVLLDGRNSSTEIFGRVLTCVNQVLNSVV